MSLCHSSSLAPHSKHWPGHLIYFLDDILESQSFHEFLIVENSVLSTAFTCASGWCDNSLVQYLKFKINGVHIKMISTSVLSRPTLLPSWISLAWMNSSMNVSVIHYYKLVVLHTSEFLSSSCYLTCHTS